jgi:hypothetical protein
MRSLRRVVKTEAIKPSQDSLAANFNDSARGILLISCWAIDGRAENLSTVSRAALLRITWRGEFMGESKHKRALREASQRTGAPAPHSPSLAKARGKGNPVVLKQGMTIGSPAAETDGEFLFDCFVDSATVENCLNVEASGMIVAGRTGAGKTAILMRVEREVDNAITIDPIDMSMSYVSNSDELNFLHAIGADLDLLFQVLWRHVLCIEFIRKRWSVEDEAKSKVIFTRLYEKFFGRERDRKAIEYLRAWEGKFWITMDQNIKEMTEKVESKISAEMGTEVHKFKTRGQYDKQLGVEKKSELIARAKKIINSEQLAELTRVIDILAEQAEDDRMNKYYILIDKLDEKWVDDGIRFRLIRSLIESLKVFRRITNLKILAALRSDVLERVVQESNDLSFQREKFESYFVRLNWNRQQLRTLVDKRLEHSFKRQYSGDQIGFSDLFTSKVGRQDPFDYLVDRTLMRPRDIIAFVNLCLANAEGHYQVTASMILRAEGEYSRTRREAMESEWRSAFPTVKKVLNLVGLLAKETIEFAELRDSDKTLDLAFAIGAEPRIAFDPLHAPAEAAAGNGVPERTEFVKEIICFLYRIGAVGVKLQPGEKYMYAHHNQPLLDKVQIGDDCRIRVHLILHGAFRLRSRDDA